MCSEDAGSLLVPFTLIISYFLFLKNIVSVNKCIFFFIDTVLREFVLSHSLETVVFKISFREWSAIRFFGTQSPIPLNALVTF